MTMLRSIVVATIFNSMFPTKCYELPTWHNLVMLNPQGSDVLPPFKRMAPPPYSRYEIQPGSQGMFSDIAQDIRTRMKGIAKGPYIVVFDYGGIAPKYFSIIEDMVTGSGVRVGPLGSVMIEPPAQRIKTADERLLPIQTVDTGKPVGTMRYLKPTATVVSPTDEDVMGPPVGVIKDSPSANDGVTTMLKRNEAKPSRNDHSTANAVEPGAEINVNTPIRSQNHGDLSAVNGISSMVKLIMKSPPSALKTATSPSSTTVSLESVPSEENIASTTDAVVFVEGGRALDPSTAIKTPADSVNGALGVGPTIGLGKSLLKDVTDGMTTSLAPTSVGIGSMINANPDGASTETALSDSRAITNESVNSEKNSPANTGDVVVFTQSKQSLPYQPSANGGVTTMKRIESDPTTATLPIASTVLSTVGPIARTPVSVRQEGLLTTAGPAPGPGLTYSPMRIEATTSITETFVEGPVSFPNDQPSITDGKTPKVERIVVKPSIPSLQRPVSSPVEKIMEVSIVSGGTSKQGVPSTTEGLNAKHSSTTLPTAESAVENVAAPTSVLNGNGYAGGGIISILKPITQGLTISSKEMTLSSTTEASRLPINDEGHIPSVINPVIHTEGIKSLLNETNPIMPHLKPADAKSSTGSSGTELGKVKNITQKPSAVNPSPLGTDAPTIKIHSSTISRNKIDYSKIHDEVPSTTMMMEVKRPTTPRPSVSPTSVVGTQLNILQDNSPANNGVASTLTSIVAQPSVLPAASSKEIIVKTPVLHDGSVKDELASTLSTILAEPSVTRSLRPSTQTTTSTPIIILNLTSGGDITSTHITSPSITPETVGTTTTEGSTPHTINTILPFETADNAPSGMGPSIETKPSTIRRPNIGIDSSTVETISYVPSSIPNKLSTANEEATPKFTRIEAKPSIDQRPTDRTIAETQVSKSVGDSSENDKVGSDLNSIVETQFTTEIVSTTSKKSIILGTILNEDDSGGASIKRLSKADPADDLKTIASMKSTAAIPESLNAEGIFPKTITSDVPIGSEHSLPNHIESTAKTENTTSEKDSYGIGLGPSLVRGITDGVTSSIVSAGSGIASMVKRITTNPASTVMDKSSTSRSVETSEPIDAEDNTPSTIEMGGAIEGGRAIQVDPTVAQSSMKPSDRLSGKYPSGLGLGELKISASKPSTIMLPDHSTDTSTLATDLRNPSAFTKGETIANDGMEPVMTPIVAKPSIITSQLPSAENIANIPLSVPYDYDSSQGVGMASTMKQGMTESGLKADLNGRITEALQVDVTEESVPTPTGKGMPIEVEQYQSNEPTGNQPFTNDLGLVLGKAPSNAVPGDLKSIEETSTITLMSVSKDSPTVFNGVNTSILFPKNLSPANNGGSSGTSTEVRPSIPTLTTASSKTVIAEPTVRNGEDRSSSKDGDVSFLTRMEGRHPKPQTAGEETDVNTPLSILNDAIRDRIAPLMKSSTTNPASTIASSMSTSAGVVSVNNEDTTLSTTKMDELLDGGRSLPNEPTTKVSAVEMASDKNTSSVGLGTSLFRGIADGVASAGSGIASMMKLIISKPASALMDMASPSSTAGTLGVVTTDESIPSATNQVVPISGERSLKNATPIVSQSNNMDWKLGKDPSLIGLSKSLLKIIAKGVLNGVLDGVKAIEFPGETSIALLYPNRMVSVADKSTNEIMYFNPLSNVSLDAGDAQSLYHGLKPVTTEVSFIIKSRGFNCVPLKLTQLNLNLYVVDSIVFGEGNICGLENMQPGNTVTITKDDKDIMEVTMPLVLKDLTVKINSVDINNYYFSLVKGQPIEAIVKAISCKGTFSFRKGTPFELTSFRMEWGDISGVHLKLEGALEEGSPVSGAIDNIADALSGVIKSFISPILEKIEKQITKSILGS